MYLGKTQTYLDGGVLIVESLPEYEFTNKVYGKIYNYPLVGSEIVSEYIIQLGCSGQITGIKIQSEGKYVYYFTYNGVEFRSPNGRLISNTIEGNIEHKLKYPIEPKYRVDLQSFLILKKLKNN